MKAVVFVTRSDRSSSSRACVCRLLTAGSHACAEQIVMVVFPLMWFCTKHTCANTSHGAAATLIIINTNVHKATFFLNP